MYTDWQLPATQWDRYLRHFDSLCVFARRMDLPPHLHGVDDLERTSRARVEFVFLPDLSSLRCQLLDRHRAMARVRSIVAAADGVIARLPSEIGLVSAVAGHLLGKPVALEIVTCGWDSLWNYGSVRTKLYAPVMHLRMRRAVRRAEHVLYVTESFCRAAIRRPPATPRPAPMSSSRRRITGCCSGAWNVRAPRLSLSV